MRQLVYSFLFNRQLQTAEILYPGSLDPKQISLSHLLLYRNDEVFFTPFFFFACQNVDRLSPLILMQTMFPVEKALLYASSFCTAISTLSSLFYLVRKPGKPKNPKKCTAHRYTKMEAKQTACF